MKVIYYCYGGTHSSVVAASIHAGLLPRDRVPTGEELLSLPLFDTLTTGDIGKCYRVGSDEEGNEIFVMGMGPAKAIVKRAIACILDLYGMPQNDILFVNALPGIGVLARLGGMLSRRLCLPRIGRPLAVLGVIRCYPRLLRLVEETRGQIRKTCS